jgi:hypothetical protein
VKERSLVLNLFGARVLGVYTTEKSGREIISSKILFRMKNTGIFLIIGELPHKEENLLA